MFKKLHAFTMAEAILVMTILGIIATIMISTLKPAEYKEKSMQIMAKKVLSEIDVATMQIIMNNTVDGTFGTLIESNSSNIFNICNSTEDLSDISNKVGTLYKTYLTAIRKTPKKRLSPTGNNFVLKDGASIGIITFGWVTDVNSIFPGETEFVNVINGPCGWLNFDINDGDPPNVYGKDRFQLPLGPSGIMYAD